MKYICNQLYKHLINKEYENQILYLTNEECEECAANYDLSEVVGMIMQPFYVNKKFLDRMPALRWVQVTSAGYDKVDIEEVKRRGLLLTNTRGVMSISIAEDVFAKMLFFSRRIREVEENKINADWSMFGQNQWMCSCYEDLYQKNLGIMGFGSIGSEIAKRAKAFDMNVLAYNIFPIEDRYVDHCYVGDEERMNFLERCDYLVVAMPLNPDTYHTINEDVFSCMKKSAVLINIARGAIVKTEALVQALKSGKIRGAALDVFEEEPLPKESELWNEVPNLFISSHKAGMGDSWKGFIGRLIMDNIEHFNKNEDLENIISL